MIYLKTFGILSKNDLFYPKTQEQSNSYMSPLLKYGIFAGITK